MADVHSKVTRSYNMSQIRGKNTKPEMIVRKYLFANGLRYKLHDKKLPGKPDLVFPRRKTVIFVNGCFWHGHAGCSYFVIPKTRTRWWMDKINGNKIKDAENIKALINLGWKVIIVWACDLRPSNKEKRLTKLLNEIN